MSEPVPFELPPGVVKTDKDHALEGRYTDMDKVRFNRMKYEKVKGWVKWCYQAFVGVARGMFGWVAAGNNVYLAFGTQCKLYAIQLPTAEDPGTVTNGWGAGGWGEYGWGAGVEEAGTVTDDLLDITPLQDSGTLTDPFSTTYGSGTVTVTHSSHGLEVGQTVVFTSVASEVGELALAGEYLVTAVPTTNTYQIVHAQLATFTETGGGSVDYEYEIACGNLSAASGLGYGIGGYGLGTYGTPRSSSSFLQFPRFWSFDNYGTELLALCNGHPPFRWDPASDARAAAISNAPSDNFFHFLTEEGFLIVLGAGGTPMKAQWADQVDITLWTPASTNSAGSKLLRHGSRLMAGAALGDLVSLVWSDTALYTFTHRGTGLIFDIKRKGKACGLIGPHAFKIADNRAFWMGTSSFHMFSGYVTEIPNVEDIQDWVFDNLTEAQRSKAFCEYIEDQREVWWYFPAASAEEPGYYVAVNIDRYYWIKGTWDRTASFFNPYNDARPIQAGSDSYLYIHETGVDADGAAMEAFIETAPVDIGDGKRTMDVMGLIPSFKRRTGSLDITVTTREQPDSTTTETQSETLAEGDTIMDLRISGRLAALKITSNEIGGDFREGKTMLEVEPSGEGRR